MVLIVDSYWEIILSEDGLNFSLHLVIDKGELEVDKIGLFFPFVFALFIGLSFLSANLRAFVPGKN